MGEYQIDTVQSVSSSVKLWKIPEGTNMNSEIDESKEISSIEILTECESKGALKLLNDIQKVEKIKPKVQGDDYIYRFKIKGKTLIISSSKMPTPSMFVRRYLEEFDELPHKDVSGNWELIINALNEKGLIVHVEDDKDIDETYAAETFLNVIRKFPILKKGERDKYKQKKEVLFSHNSNLYMPTEMVKKVLDITRTRIKIQRLNQLNRKYKIDTGTLRYGNELNDTIRCWIFSSDLISVISINNLPEYPQQYQVQEHEMVAY
jgi:hypothetical protein